MSTNGDRIRRSLLASRNVEGLRPLLPFPAVSERDMIAGRSYEGLWASWRSQAMRPLRIRAQMSAGAIPAQDGTLHLDSILSGALLNSPLVGATVGQRREFCVPLPVELAWVSSGGLPLWTTTSLRPAGSSQQGEIYIHKRHPSDKAPLASHVGANTSAGRYKDVRMPLRTTVAPVFEGWCIGVPDVIETLLSDVLHVGRKGSIGQGRVLGWSVTETDVDADWIMHRRPVPLEFLAETGAQASAAEIEPRGSWTAPYWDATRHAVVRRASWTP